MATGTLFADGDSRFLITAAHVIDDFTQPGREFRVGLGNPERPQPLNLSTLRIKRDDSLDVAVITLNPLVVAELFQPLFVQRSQVSADELEEDATCLVAGYLAEGSHASADATQFVLRNFDYWTKPHIGRVNSSSFDPTCHALLRYHKEAWSVRDGVRTENPKVPGGMSGANVWRVFSAEELDRGWDSAMLKVVGVQTCVYDDTIMRYTPWKHVLPLITSP